jgi:hypothetical protein
MPSPRAVLVAFLFGLLGTLAAPQVGLTRDDQPLNPVGRPKAFDAGKQPMVAVWFDKTWHLAVTTKKGNKDLFTGSVRADKGQVIGVFDKLEKGKGALVDWIIPHKDGSGFDFRFTNTGFIDKTQFKTSPEATTLTVNVQLNGAPAPVRVFVGKAGKHPGSVPFTLPANP